MSKIKRPPVSEHMATVERINLQQNHAQGQAAIDLN